MESHPSHQHETCLKNHGKSANVWNLRISISVNRGVSHGYGLIIGRLFRWGNAPTADVHGYSSTPARTGSYFDSGNTHANHIGGPCPGTHSNSDPAARAYPNTNTSHTIPYVNTDSRSITETASGHKRATAVLPSGWL